MQTQTTKPQTSTTQAAEAFSKKMNAFQEKYSSASKVRRAGYFISHPLLSVAAHMHEKTKITDVQAEESCVSMFDEAGSAKSKYKMLFDTCAAGVFMTSLKGKEFEMNKAMADMLGIEPGEDGATGGIVSYFKSYGEYNVLLSMLVTHESVMNFPATFLKSDGSEINVLISANMIDRRCVFGTILDITESEQAHARLVLANAEVENLNASLKGLFRRISHDLKSPFTGIIGGAQALKEEPDMDLDDRKVYIDMVHDAGKSTFAFLEKLLEWARVSTNGAKFSKESIDLNSHVACTLQLATANAANKGILLVNKVPENVYVHADSDLLDLILHNLVSNSVKYTPDGGEISVSASVLPNELVLIKVTDNGVGMDEDTKSSLFTFEVKSKKGTAGELGTGLGLASVHEAVKKHGGDIWVESKPGEGTSFIFTVPVAHYVPAQAVEMSTVS
ncbi:MAG: ATP-binding protein [Candidatus Micrarchaeia archaeon]